MSEPTRLVQVRQQVLKRNDLEARALRLRFHEAGVYVASLVSSPGAEAANVRTYASGHFAFELDNVTAGFIEKVSGGDAVGNVVSEKVTAVGAFQKKHIGGIRYEDITFSAGLGMSKPFLE